MYQESHRALLSWDAQSAHGLEAQHHEAVGESASPCVHYALTGGECAYVTLACTSSRMNETQRDRVMADPRCFHTSRLYNSNFVHDKELRIVLMENLF